jgi:flagellar hook-associated protein 2
MTGVSSSSASGSTDLAIAGLASGFDWQSLISQLVQVQREPETLLENQQSTLETKNTALGSIQSALETLQNDVKTLSDPSFFQGVTATSSAPSTATASAATGTAAGTYNFDVTQLASASVLEGAPQTTPLSPTDDVSNLTLSSAPFATPVTAGTFTIDGQQITIASTDTLQDVFNQISKATDGKVTASYSGGSEDAITLSSSSPIVLGSDTDTSNFLQAAKLTNSGEVDNSGTYTITSSGTLGTVDVTGAMDQSNLAIPVNDGGNGDGAFEINGVTINYSASADSINDVINRINSSGAGVVAAFNPVSDQLTLTNTSTGDLGISVQDLTGNFLAATGLATTTGSNAGTLAAGKNLLYTIGNSNPLSSQTNTITPDSSGVTGLTVTPSSTGKFTVTVAPNTSGIASAITQFVTDYNSAQTAINNQTAVTTNSDGSVTAGPLTGDLGVEQFNSELRGLANSVVSGLSGTVASLNDLGFASNGQNDSLTTSDTTSLDTALTNDLAGVAALFTNPTNGLAAQFTSLLNGAIGTNGTLVSEQASLTTASNDITKQISNIETNVQAYQTQLTNEFVAMEAAESQTNEDESYLARAFPSSG